MVPIEISIHSPNFVDRRRPTPRRSTPDTLADFVRDFLARGLSIINAQEFYDYGSVFSHILHRDPPWQAELFILRPNRSFPRDHRHPDVDSIEYGLSEQCPIIVNGRPGVDIGFRRNRAALGQLGGIYKVGAEDWHRVGDVPQGGTFLSLQQWHNGIAPTSVGLNWEGTPVSAEHRALLRRPDAKWIKTVRREVLT